MCVHGRRRGLIDVGRRMISIDEAQSLLRKEAKILGDQNGLKMEWSEEELKQVYLKLAK